MGNSHRSKQANEEDMPKTFFTSFSNLGRQWYKRALPEQIEKTRSTNFEFTVASYNVLADQLMQENPYLYYKGKQRDPEVFDWNYRKHNLLKEIKHANADILCLQEVQEDHYYDWFNPCLQEYGYSGVFKKRSGNKPDGCGTFFKQNKFSLESVHPIDYFKPNVPLMDRNNVAILLFLTVRNNRAKKKSTLCIGNTHLLFNKNRGDIKLTQLAHLFAEMEHYSKLGKYDVKRLSTIICGDFNSHPFSPLYNFIVNGELKIEGVSQNVVSGQNENRRPKHNDKKFGKVLFSDDVGLSHDCRWTSCQQNLAETVNNERNMPELDDAMTFNVETGCYEKRTVSAMKGSRKKSKTNTRDGEDIIVTYERSQKINELLREDSKKSTGSKSGSKANLRRFESVPQSIPVVADNCIEKPGHLRHRYLLDSSYTHFNADGSREVTTCHDREAATVDYIFYSKFGPREGPGHDRLFLRAILSLLSEPELNKLHKLPNRYLSSDHVLLQSSFVLQQQ